MRGAYFTESDGVLHPELTALSGWATEIIRGPAVAAVLARAAERAAPDPGMRPARASFELFRPARMVDSTTTAQTIRHGGRLCAVDTSLVQSGVVVARANITFLRPSEEPPGVVWRPGPTVDPPARDASPDPDGRFYRSDAGWDADPQAHTNDARKHVWQLHRELVTDEEPTPFQLAASAADLSSLVTHWGTSGIEYINSDVTLSLARLPVGPGIGLSAMQFLSSEGISASSAVMFDEQGPFATSTLSGLANAHRRAVHRNAAQ